MLTVAAARARILAGAVPLPPVAVPLVAASGRYLAGPLVARRSQPDAPLSAMDGFAVRAADLPGPWRIVGESAAGHALHRALQPGEAARISTGAMMPPGSDTVVIKESATLAGEHLTLAGDAPAPGAWVRDEAGDFAEGATLLAAGTQVSPAVIALAATAGHALLRVGGAPRVALIATGDELLPPGQVVRHRTPSSNSTMLAAMLAPLGCGIIDLGIVPDRRAALAHAIDHAAHTADIIVTSGAASVGDHDHLQGAIADAGGTIDFWRIAMKPGKPLLHGGVGNARLLGLPGNPASAFVTALLFLLPLCRALAGAADPAPRSETGRLGVALPAGGPREEYVRARFDDRAALWPFPDQNSGALHPLAQAQALLIRPVDAPPAPAGSEVAFLRV